MTADRDWPDENAGRHWSDNEPTNGAPDVEDEAALMAAEEAVRHADDEQSALERSDIPSDEPWVPVATAAALDPGRSLEPVYEALCEAGIPAGFDPYRPGVASNPYPTVQRSFHLVVPQSRAQAAREVLRTMNVAVPSAVGPTSPREWRRGRSQWQRIGVLVIVLVLLAFAGEIIISLLYQYGVLP